MANSPRVVAVLDSDPDTVEILKTILELDGFVVVTGDLNEFRLGKEDLNAFLERTQPHVIVYDLGLPYESNWHYLQTARRTAAFTRAGLVITTTNQEVVRRLFGVHAIEILGKPYDLGLLVAAVKSACPEKPGADAPPPVH